MNWRRWSPLGCSVIEGSSPVRATDAGRLLYTHLRVKSMVLFKTSISAAAGVDALGGEEEGRMKDHMN